MFRFRKLDIFIAKQFLLLFVATFFICLFVLMMQFLWQYIDNLIGKGLSLDVLARFFWYMALFLIPQALQLAILLSSLITFGNLGESSELTAIKAAGISMLQAMRPVIVIVLLITATSYYFQNVIGPNAHKSLRQLMISMKQKSPELEIPEGVFYDGIPGSNIYVTKKNLDTGMLYGITIYRMNGSYEDQAIILADSGMLQSTAEKKHLLLTLWSGEWFENMQQQEVAGSASIPYRRETFSYKKILLDFDGEFNMTDAANIASSASSKSTARLLHDLDSLREYNDSTGRAFFQEAKNNTFFLPPLPKKDSLRALKDAARGAVNLDTLFNKLTTAEKQSVISAAAQDARMESSSLEMREDYARQLNRQERIHMIEIMYKMTLALSCLIFLFIGAPLGAIIRKGGLGMPVVISVLVFIVYYIFDNSGRKMAKDDNWDVYFGVWLSTAVLAPLAVFLTYKANNDSTVFNADLYKELLRRMLGLRLKRNVTRKEVIIDTPDYQADARMLRNVSTEISQYSEEHKLLRWPNPLSVFFKAGDDQKIEHISAQLEEAIEDLGNTRDKRILSRLNHYPILATHAHTRPFRRRWLNAVTGIFLPTGVFFYFRMIRFRLRLYKDLHDIRHTTDRILPRIDQLAGTGQ